MDTMDTLLRDHDRRTDADATIRAQAERIAQLESSNRALHAVNEELRAAIKQMVLDRVALYPPQPMDPVDELRRRLWMPERAAS